MSRIAGRFAELRAKGRGALIPYLEAFDPDLETSRAILHGMASAGADLIEIGVPFSDPMADGPIIQAAALRGLKAGATLAGVVAMVGAYRREDDATPVILMGYLNPILAYGTERFCADAAAAGVDGLIVVDLPAEEQEMLLPFAQMQGLDLIRLVAPTTHEARLPLVLAGSSGFVYYISLAGITGTGMGTAAHLAAAVPKLRAVCDLPVAIGFGVRSPEQVRAALEVADAAVVASSLIEKMAATLDDGRATEATVETVLAEVRRLSAAANSALPAGF